MTAYQKLTPEQYAQIQAQQSGTLHKQYPPGVTQMSIAPRPIGELEKLRFTVTTLEAMYEALKKSVEWQPISTAPSGDILISDGKVVTLMEWFEGEEDWNAAQQWATHWMPLPSPPPVKAQPNQGE